MLRRDCPDCQALLTILSTDIPTTNERLATVFNDQDCHGAHTLDAWVTDPT